MNTESSRLLWSKANNWALPELKKAVATGLIPDRLGGRDFTKAITRAEFAAVAVRLYEALADQPAAPCGTNPFRDTDDADVLKAYSLGMTNGTGANTFHPGNILTREEAATMLTRVLKSAYISGWTLPADGNYTLVFTMPPLFPDDAKISNWAKPSVYFMAAGGVIKGLDTGDFAPKNTTDREAAVGYANITCEQALAIAVRMVDAFKGKPLKYRKESSSDTGNDGELNMEVLARMFAVFPRSDALDIIWYTLRGYWTAADNLFARFILQEGLFGIEYGIRGAEGRGFGAFTGGRPTGAYSAEMTFRFPARQADELTGALPEMDVTVCVDVSGLNQDGKINIKIPNHGHGGWYTYANNRATATLCAFFYGDYDGRFEYRDFPCEDNLTVETLAAGLSDWSGLNFQVGAAVSGLSVTVDWAADSDLFAGGRSIPNEAFVFRETEMREWFMLDSLWHTIKENFGVDDVYYTMDRGRELKVPIIGYPTLFPRDIPYLGSPFYFAHRGLKDE